MQYNIQDPTALDPALLAEELQTICGTNYGISTAGNIVNTNLPFADAQAETLFQTVLDDHVLPAIVATRALKKVIKTLEVVVQKYLDTTAQAKGYDNIVSACSYASGSVTNPYQVEGLSFLDWRAAVWAHCYTVMTSVQAGTATMPTEAELIAGLPVRV